MPAQQWGPKQIWERLFLFYIKELCLAFLPTYVAFYTWKKLINSNFFVGGPKA